MHVSYFKAHKIVMNTIIFNEKRNKAISKNGLLPFHATKISFSASFVVRVSTENIQNVEKELHLRPKRIPFFALVLRADKYPWILLFRIAISLDFGKVSF